MDSNPLRNNENRRALTIKEASEYCCVSEGTVRYWVSNGLLSHEELPGKGKGGKRFRLIRKKDLDEFLDRHYRLSNDKAIENKQNRTMTLLPRKQISNY